MRWGCRQHPLLSVDITPLSSGSTGCETRCCSPRSRPLGDRRQAHEQLLEIDVDGLINPIQTKFHNHRWSVASMLPDWLLSINWIPIFGLFLAIAGPLALGYRFWWGSKSQIHFKQMNVPRERFWGSGRREDIPVWSNYFHFIGVNRGWWPGLIWNIQIEKVKLGDGTTASVDSNDVQQLEFIPYKEGGGTERLDLENIHTRQHRTVSGRDILYFKLVPFIKDESRLVERLKESDTAKFTFAARMEDNQRSYTKHFTVERNVEDIIEENG